MTFSSNNFNVYLDKQSSHKHTHIHIAIRGADDVGDVDETTTRKKAKENRKKYEISSPILQTNKNEEKSKTPRETLIAKGEE